MRFRAVDPNQGYDVREASLLTAGSLSIYHSPAAFVFSYNG